MNVERRRLTIEPAHSYSSIVRQCPIGSAVQHSITRRPRDAVEPGDVRKDAGVRISMDDRGRRTLMRRIDELFLETPFYGARQMARQMRRQSYVVGCKRAGRLVAKMGLAAVEYCGRPSSASRRWRRPWLASARPRSSKTDPGSQFISPRLPYERIYLHVFETGSELRAELSRSVGYYNADRPHSAPGGRKPDEAYHTIQPTPLPGARQRRA
jgi:hypothetical protein